MRCRPAGRSCTRASPAGCWCRSRRTRCRTGRSCCPTRRDPHRDRRRARRQRANFDMQSLASLLHGDRIARAPLGAPGALPAPARLELLRHAAPQAALARRRGLSRHAAPPGAARLRHRRRARGRARRRLLGADRRDRRRQVDPDRRAAARAGQPRRCRRGARRRARAPRSAPSSTRRRRWPAGSTRPASTRGDTLLLRRTIDAQGKSRAWINGSPATVAQLREAADQLVDIHGQHAWQSLTRPAAVRALLDAQAGVDTAPLAALWQRWKAADAALADARAQQARRWSASASAWPGRSARSTSSRPATASGTS